MHEHSAWRERKAAAVSLFVFRQARKQGLGVVGLQQDEAADPESLVPLEPVLQIRVLVQGARVGQDTKARGASSRALFSGLKGSGLYCLAKSPNG